MSGRVLDEALENARLVIARIPTPGFVLALVMFGWFASQAVAGPLTIIYKNTDMRNQFLPIGQIPPGGLPAPQEVRQRLNILLGGEVALFKFAYFTPSQEKVAFTVIFYSNGTKIAEFPFTDLPGFDPNKRK